MIRLSLGLCLLLLSAAPSWATQYANPYRQTVWNNITDNLHTIGQTSQQAQSTKIKLRNARIHARLRQINQEKYQAWLAKNNF